MATGPQLDARMRQAQAAAKAQRAQRQLNLVKYAVEDDDILILSGPYINRYVSEVFLTGPNERDYIVRNLCMRNDPEVLKIIGKLCGK
jgi:hypothetical protein